MAIDPLKRVIQVGIAHIRNDRHTFAYIGGLAQERGTHEMDTGPSG